MPDEGLVCYVRRWHFGDTLTELAKSERRAHEECIKRKIRTKDEKERSIKDFLIEEGTLIETRRSNGYWKYMPDEELVHYARSWHYRDTLSEFAESRDAQAYKQCKKRKIKVEGGKEISIKDFLVEEGTLISEKRAKGYYQNFKNIETELAEVIKKLGYFPTQRELLNLGHWGLKRAISMEFGGLVSVRLKMGY